MGCIASHSFSEGKGVVTTSSSSASESTLFVIVVQLRNAVGFVSSYRMTVRVDSDVRSEDPVNRDVDATIFVRRSVYPYSCRTATKAGGSTHNAHDRTKTDERAGQRLVL